MGVDGGSLDRAGATDDEVIRASVRDPWLFDELFQRHFHRVHAYVVRRIGESVAEQVSVEAFVRAFVARVGYEERSPDAAPWIFGLATAAMRYHDWVERGRMDSWARSAALARARASDEASGTSRVPFELLDAIRSVAASLPILDRTDRDVLLLKAWAELSESEIANALGLPEGVVEVRMDRALWRILSLADIPADLADREAPGGRLGRGMKLIRMVGSDVPKADEAARERVQAALNMLIADETTTLKRRSTSSRIALRGTGLEPRRPGS